MPVDMSLSTDLRARVAVLDVLDREQSTMTYTELANVIRISRKRVKAAAEALVETGEVVCLTTLARNGRVAHFYSTLCESEEMAS